MKYNDLINELLDLLDKNDDIKKIKSLKKELLNDDKLLENIRNYQEVKSVPDKKKLYENKKYLEYLECESNINLLLYEIKKKFAFNNRKCQHESH